MPAMAIAASISTMAAQCIGAGKSVRLPLIASRGLVIALAMTGVMAVALVLVDHRVLQLFLPANGDAVELAQHINRVGVCRSEEHTSELQSLMRISYAVFCLKKKKKK